MNKHARVGWFTIDRRVRKKEIRRRGGRERRRIRGRGSSKGRGPGRRKE